MVVLDSEYVFKGIMQWSDKWRRHNWRTSSGEVGHRDLWEHILWLREGAGDLLQLRWVPSHLNVPGNDAANELAEQGRCLHPNNLVPLSKRRRVTEWDALGLEPMQESREQCTTSDVDSGCGSSGESGDEQLGGGDDSCSEVSSSDAEVQYSTDISDTRLWGRLSSSDSEGFSTDVSDTRKKRRRAGWGRDGTSRLTRDPAHSWPSTRPVIAPEALPEGEGPLMTAPNGALLDA